MSRPDSVFERLKTRGGEVFAQLSGELMANPGFERALRAALEGKQKLDQAAGRALKQMNIPTRSEFKRALARIEALEQEVAALKAEPAARRPAKPKRRKS